MLALAAQLRVGAIDTPVAAFAGEGAEGVPGVAQGAAPVVKLQTDPEVELPQLFLATTFQ